jgi:peptidoglycan/xylan/chitin deacetylase (PgdA/CDA1 family)
MGGVISRLKAPLRSPLAWARNLLLRCSRRRTGLVLVYHAVGDPNETFSDGKLVPSIGTRLFEAQMRHLSRHYRPVAASEIRAAAAARRRWQRFPVAVTFDDDAPSHTRAAMPILRRHGMPATFFLSGASLREPFAFWYERLQLAVDRGVLDQEELLTEAPPSERPRIPADIHQLGEAVKSMPPRQRDRAADLLRERLGGDPPDSGMRAADVHALVNEGFEIGFHTRRHYVLPTLDDYELKRALEDGRDELAAEAGTKLSMIAYPNGDADARVAAATRAGGYRLGFTDEPAPARPEDDPMLIGRVAPPHTTVGSFALLVARVIGSAPVR